MDYNANCDFCQRPTNRRRDEDGELLCHACRQEQRTSHERYLNHAIKLALQRLPETLTDRILKAADLAESGYVSRNGNGYIVRSQTGNGEYHINGAGCNCPDAAHRAPVIMSKPRCKHQLAVDLLRKAKILRSGPTDLSNRREWCDKCQDSTPHGFGIGCLICDGTEPVGRKQRIKNMTKMLA